MFTNIIFTGFFCVLVMFSIGFVLYSTKMIAELIIAF